MKLLKRILEKTKKNNESFSNYDALNYHLCVLSEEQYELFGLLDKIRFFKYGYEYVPMILERISQIRYEWIMTYKRLMEMKYKRRFYFYEES